MVAQDYLSLVRSQDLDGLEQAWTQATADPGNVDGYCQALAELGNRGEYGTALELGSRMLEALEEKGRMADAVRIGTTLVINQAHNENLARKVLGLIERAFATEPWFELAMESSGLGPNDLSSTTERGGTKVSSRSSTSRRARSRSGSRTVSTGTSRSRARSRA